MDKPLMVARQQTIDQLISVINNSGLPPVIIEPLIAGILQSLRDQMEQQYLNELAEYNKSIEKDGAEV